MENGTAFRMNWGDPDLAAAPAYTTNGQMWIDAGYVGVWHLGEAADAPFSREENDHDYLPPAPEGAVFFSHELACEDARSIYL